MNDNSPIPSIESIQTPMVNKMKISIDKPNNIHILSKKDNSHIRERINASLVPERVSILENKEIIDLKVIPTS